MVKEKYSPRNHTLTSTTKDQRLTYHGRLNKSRIQGNELSKLNRCQMYLKVTCLSGVSTGDGIGISPSSWKGTQRKKRRTIPVAIPTKKSQPSMRKVASRPPDDLQNHPNTGSTTSQKTGKLALRIRYHRLDIPHPPQDRIYYRFSTGWLLYRHLLCRQGQASHRHLTPPTIPLNNTPTDNSIQTKAEEISEQVIKTTGISLMPNIPKVDSTPLHWNPPDNSK